MTECTGSSLAIPSRLGDYKVQLEEDLGFLDQLIGLPKKLFVVDAKVWEIHRASSLRNLPEEETLVLPIHEDRKNFESVRLVYDRLLASSAKRNLTLIAIGGGILQDIAGYAASTIYRGIPWVFVPTTLLAQADSCIGGKTSLNYGEFKNLLGTFYPPRAIHIHVDFLKTQMGQDFYSGLGEVVKLHLLGAERDGELVTRVLPSLLPTMALRDSAALLEGIQGSLGIKRGFIIEDEFDSGRRNLLNYGHCFGHALESASQFRIPHGQAVVVGMIAANMASRNRGWLAGQAERDVREQLLLPILKLKPTSEELETGPIIEAMKNDKKRTGDGLPLILYRDQFLFERIGDLSVDEATKVLSELRELFLG